MIEEVMPPEDIKAGDEVRIMYGKYGWHTVRQIKGDEVLLDQGTDPVHLTAPLYKVRRYS